jgi:hypothetical protein
MNDLSASLPVAVKPPPVSQDAEDPPPAGHNNPPPYDPVQLEEAAAKTAEFLDAGDAWLDLKEIASAEQAEKLTDFVGGARKVYKAVDELRKRAKAPHDAAAKAVQDAFTPLLDRLEAAVKKVKPLQTAWLLKLEEIDRQRRAEAAAEARRKAEEAERLASQAQSRNDIAGEVRAAELQKEADKLQKLANRTDGPKAASATGGGRTMALRDQRSAEITNINLLFVHFREAPEVRDVLQRLANAEIRSSQWDGKDLPGTTTKTEKVAA